MRHGKTVRTRILTDLTRKHVQAHVREHVTPGAALNTDAYESYEGLSRDYVHNVIDHAEAYVNGNVHTNKIENYWSLLKRMLKGTYVAVEPFHLFRYLDEQAFRFNERGGTDASRFANVLAQVVGRRLTFADVTAASNAGNFPA